VGRGRQRPRAVTDRRNRVAKPTPTTFRPDRHRAEKPGGLEVPGSNPGAPIEEKRNVPNLPSERPTGPLRRSAPHKGVIAVRYGDRLPLAGDAHGRTCRSALARREFPLGAIGAVIDWLCGLTLFDHDQERAPTAPFLSRPSLLTALLAPQQHDPPSHKRVKPPIGNALRVYTVRERAASGSVRGRRFDLAARP
jgi:hypothetical protein